jgi:hypothetical protein
MLKAYRYVFYLLYYWVSRSNWETRPEIPAFVLFTVVTWATGLLIVEIAECARKRLVGPLSNLQAIVSAAALAMPLYFLVLHDDNTNTSTKNSETSLAISGDFEVGW